MNHEPEKSPARGARAVVHVPVATVDGTASAAWLSVSGNGEELVTLEFGTTKITVSGVHLGQALTSLSMLRDQRAWCCPPPPPPPMAMR